MNKRAALQIAHAGCDLRSHVHEHYRVNVLAVACTEIVQEISAAHELRNDVERRFSRAYSEELDEIWVSHLFHYGGFFQEIFQGHCVIFQSFNRHLGGV